MAFNKGQHTSIKRILSFGILFIFLSSCAYIRPQEKVNESFIGDKEKGAVVISVKRSWYGIASPNPSFVFREKEGGAIGILYNSPTAIKFDKDGTGFIETLVLPAGRYEIFKWDLFFNLGTIYWYEHSAHDFSIPFTVEPGKINYLGEITLDKYDFRFSDARERDFGFLYEIYPNFRNVATTWTVLACEGSCAVGSLKGKSSISIPQPVFRK